MPPVDSEITYPSGAVVTVKGSFLPEVSVTTIGSTVTRETIIPEERDLNTGKITKPAELKIEEIVSPEHQEILSQTTPVAGATVTRLGKKIPEITRPILHVTLSSDNQTVEQATPDGYKVKATLIPPKK